MKKISFLVMLTLIILAACTSSKDDEPSVLNGPSVVQVEYILAESSTGKVQGKNLNSVSWISDNEDVCIIIHDAIYSFSPGTAHIKSDNHPELPVITVVVTPKNDFFYEPPVLRDRATYEEIIAALGEPYQIIDNGTGKILNFKPEGVKVAKLSYNIIEGYGLNGVVLHYQDDVKLDDVLSEYASRYIEYDPKGTGYYKYFGQPSGPHSPGRWDYFVGLEYIPHVMVSYRLDWHSL